MDRGLSSGISHNRDDILARYVTFLRTLEISPSSEVSVLVNIVGRDIKTNTGSNLHFIRELSGLDTWCGSSSQVNQVLGEKLREVPAQDLWRLAYLGKFLEQRGEEHHETLDTRELTELLDSLCIN